MRKARIIFLGGLLPLVFFGAAQAGTVRPFYIEPTDLSSVQSEIDEIDARWVEVRRWYENQLKNGTTFQLATTTKIFSTHNWEWFGDNPPLGAETYHYNSRDDFISLQGSKSGSPDKWHIYVKATDPGDQSNGTGFAFTAPGEYASFIPSQLLYNATTLASPPAHELGHNLGFNHLADGSIMTLGSCQRFRALNTKSTTYFGCNYSSGMLATLREHSFFALDDDNKYVFWDRMNETSNTELAAHSSDIEVGGSYESVISNTCAGGIIVDATNDYLSASASSCSADGGVLYKVSDTISSNNQDIRVRQKEGAQSDDFNTIGCRYSNGTGYLFAFNETDSDLYEMGGTYSIIQEVDGPAITNGAIVRMTCVENYITAYVDDVVVASFVDSTYSTGQPVIGMGDVGIVTTWDVTTQKLDDFMVALYDGTRVRYAGTVAEDISTGEVSWSNYSNATSSDDIRSVYSVENFSGSCNNTGNTFVTIKIVKDGNPTGTDPVPTINADVVPCAELVHQFGFFDDLWGTTLTESDVESSNFGVAISVKNSGGSESYFLEATNFGFEIPDGATIDGVIVSIEGLASSTPTTQRVEIDSVGMEVFFSENETASVAASGAIRTAAMRIRSGGVNIR